MKTSLGQMAVLLAVSTLSLCGCTQKEEVPWEPASTALEVTKDGLIKETILENLDESWYSGEELARMITASVTGYNQEFGSGAISEEEVTVDEGKVTVKLTYKSYEDVARYNQVPFYSGSMLGAQMEGYLFDTSFYKISKSQISGAVMDNQEPLSHKEYQVAIADTAHMVHVPGNIVYISANASLVDTNTAKASSTEAAEDMDQSYIYVIYEF